MDKSIERIQIIGGVLLLLIIVIKALKVPYLSMLIMVITTAFALFLWIVMFYHLVSKWDTSRGIAILLFLMNFSLSSCMVGLLFALMFWPGDEIMMYNSLVVFGILAVVPGIFYYQLRGKHNPMFWKYINFDLIKSLILISFTALLLYLPLEKRISIFSADPIRTKEHILNRQESTTVNELKESAEKKSN